MSKPTREALDAAEAVKVHADYDRKRDGEVATVTGYAILIDAHTHLPELLAVVEAAREVKRIWAGLIEADSDAQLWAALDDMVESLAALDAAREGRDAEAE